MTTIIETLRTYIASYAGLKSNAPVWVDYLGADPTQYAIVPIAGERIIETYLDGSTLREYPFLIQSMQSTADDLERIGNNGFYEALAEWFETQTEANALPILSTGKTAEKIEAVTSGYLLEQGESGTGIYSIQCKLTYEQEK